VAKKRSTWFIEDAMQQAKLLGVVQSAGLPGSSLWRRHCLVDARGCSVVQQMAVRHAFLWTENGQNGRRVFD